MAKKRAHGEGSVYEDKKGGRWIGEVYIDGRRRRVSAKTKTDAAAALGRLIHGSEAERTADRRLTLGTHLDDWYRTSLPPKNLAPSTMQTHAWAIGVWKDRLGSKRVTNVRPRDIDRVLAELGEEMSRSSLVKLRSTLSQALKWGVRRHTVAYNAADTAELPVATKEGSGKRALSLDELERLEDAAAEHPLRALFMLCARAGLRPGEAAGVCVDAVHLATDPPTVDVVRAIQLRNGSPFLVDDLKTAGARRTVAIPRRLADTLATHIEASGQRTGLLFRSAADGPTHPSTLRAELRALCDVAEVEPITPNELRHSFTTLAAEAGLPPHQLADLLGHRSTRMVDEHYRHRPAVVRGAETL